MGGRGCFLASRLPILNKPLSLFRDFVLRTIISSLFRFRLLSVSLLRPGKKKAVRADLSAGAGLSPPRNTSPCKTRLTFVLSSVAMLHRIGRLLVGTLEKFSERAKTADRFG